MTKEKYIIDIGEEGSKGLGKLDYCFNPTTQDFLLKTGLTEGMTVLDIGCGSGVMSAWLAEQVGKNGKVIGIENDNNQLKAANKTVEHKQLDNVEFKLCSAYDIESLGMEFDLIYCRFVLHHLHKPIDVIRQIYQTLKPHGLYVAEEGIVNFAFSYPFSPAWGDEYERIPPVWVDSNEDQRDGNIGVKMYTKMHSVGFKIISAKIIHPLFITKEEKKLLLLGREEMKNAMMHEQGITEEQWQKLGKETESIVNNDAQIIGFYASCQVAGKKP